MNPSRRRLTALLFASLLVVACGRNADVSITGGRVTIPPPGAPSAGYFTIENGTAQAVEVRGISSPAFGAVEMHETRTENGVSSMHRLTSLTVPPGGSVSFAPGGKHLMLFRPQSPLAPSAPVALTFSLASPDGKETKVESSFVAGEASESH